MQRLISSFKNGHWNNWVSALSTTDNSLWNFVKTIESKYSKISRIISSNGIVTTDIANTFASHYAQQFTNNYFSHTDTLVHNTFTFWNTISILSPDLTISDEITDIKNLKINKSPGWHTINKHALKTYL